MTFARDALSKAEAVLVAQLEAVQPALAVARRLVQSFTDMARNDAADGLRAWIEDATTSDIASF